jgi:hypothetical protein|tara:strand:- start:15 stop:242 length:228 start_codon:yes stop_codon:yes gene_type:complete
MKEKAKDKDKEPEIVEKELWDHYSELPNPSWYEFKEEEREIKGALVHFYRNASKGDYLQALENAIKEIQAIKDNT